VDGLWSRSGLGHRDGPLLTLAVLAAGPNDTALDVHLDGALRSGDLSASELEEAAVHLAHYARWPVGSRLAAAAATATERARAAWPLDGPVYSGLVALVGGYEDPASAAKVDAVLHAIAADVHRLGPLGSGMLVKALRNAVLYGAYAGVSEAADVCRAAGIDEDELVAAFPHRCGRVRITEGEQQRHGLRRPEAQIETRHRPTREPRQLRPRGRVES
jgi:hypothetical protein